MKRRIFTTLAAATAVAASDPDHRGGPRVRGPRPRGFEHRSPQYRRHPEQPTAAGLPDQVDETKFKIVASLKGIGKQVYTCGTVEPGKYALREPVAVLFDLRGNAGIHGKGPFWASFDGSRVDGSAPVAVPSPAGPSNIPWLKVVGTPVPNAPGVFGKVAFIQRLDTKGGVAPASCTAPSTVSVDYSANYVFWAPKP